MMGSYRPAPPEGVWDGIAGTLQWDRKRTRLVWVGRIAAAAAVILAAGSIWILMNRNPQREIGRTVSQETTEQPETTAERPETPADRSGTAAGRQAAEAPGEVSEPPESIAERQASGQPATVTGQSTTTETNREATSPGTYTAAEGGTMTGGSDLRPGSPMRIEAMSITGIQSGEPAGEPVLDEHILSGTTTATVEDVKTDEGIDVFEEFGENGHADFDRWAIGGQVSPVYSYRNLDAAEQTAYNTGYFNEKENGIVSYAGGVNLNYYPAKRLALQSGLYYSRMGMKMENTYLASAEQKTQSPEFPSMRPALANSSGQIAMGEGRNDAVISEYKPTSEYSGWDPGDIDNREAEPEVRDGELLQHFEYLEIPLLVRYRVVDRKFGVNLLGGLSTNFLVGSNVYFQEDGSREFIGTTQDLKPVNYSSVLGMGLQYSINRNLHINMEPTFRYYLNSINTVTGVGSHPYSLGFFTGISYSF